MNTISVDVGLDDILCCMTKYDKQELADELYRDGYVPVSKKYQPIEEYYFGGAETTLEKELLKTLNAVWKNRANLNHLDILELSSMSKK